MHFLLSHPKCRSASASPVRGPRPPQTQDPLPSLERIGQQGSLRRGSRKGSKGFKHLPFGITVPILSSGDRGWGPGRLQGHAVRVARGLGVGDRLKVPSLYFFTVTGRPRFCWNKRPPSAFQVQGNACKYGGGVDSNQEAGRGRVTLVSSGFRFCWSP